MQWPRRVVLLVLCFLLSESQPHASTILVPGILTSGPDQQCITLTRPNHGVYLIDDAGMFAVGDTVVVTSAVLEECLCGGNGPYPCLRNNTIAAWRGFDFGCGRLHVDDEFRCASVDSEYGLLGIGPADGFATGDTVRVVGNVRLDVCYAIPECATDFCVLERTVASCSGGGTAAVSVSWGALKGQFR